MKFFQRILFILISLTFSRDISSKPTLDGNFEYLNVSFKDQLTFIEMNGEISNKSGKDMSVIYFSVNLYDSNGLLLNSAKMSITGLKNKQKKTFQCFIDYTKITDISTYTIEYLNSD